MIYPTASDVCNATRLQLGVWLRHLPSPGFNHVGTEHFEFLLKEEAAIMTLITNRFTECGGWTPELSKLVGWDR